MQHDNYIKFISNYDGIKTIIKLPPDQPYSDLLQSFKEFALAIGYSPRTVDEELYDSED